ncbi:MAG: 1-acyl-sn-glycerol-3-phosphate acyltransferase [Bacteroidia bacterium]|nr:1-acyl-sn-glycerol-3-phosphate acyltransferase [Bacteroidia bacterium]NNF82561.1 glycerol acyltransferase [Flavobacteriaceae bacterium]
MKKIKLFLVKWYLKTGLFFYYRSIKVHGLKNIPKDTPAMVLGNHQNALIDALLIAVNLPQFGYYLTRASVFKKPKIASLLKGLNMIPVFRIRDGWQKIERNKSIFHHCIELLNENNIVVIFPEGSHNLVRRVRPLSKGFTRIVFDFLEEYPEQELQLIPVGFNFRNATEFVDEVTMYVDKPHPISHDPNSLRHDQVVNLKSEIHQALSQLTTQIPEENYDSTLNRLNELNVNFLDPKTVNQCISSQFDSCKPQKKSVLKPVRSLLKFLLKIAMIIPYAIWKTYVQPKIVEKEFMATFRFVVVITVVPVYLILLGLAIGFLIGWEAAAIAIGSIIILSILTVKI